MVCGIRAVEEMINNPVDKSVTSQVEHMKEIFQKSVTSTIEICAGKQINRSMLAIKKPGTGLHPSKLNGIIGKRAARTIKKNNIIVSDDIDWES